MKRDKRVIPEDWITTDEAAALTGYTVHYLRKLARDERVDAIKIKRDWLLSREALLAWREEMEALGTKKHSPSRQKGADGYE